jgi:acetyltransferase-like isoleucine patch superfamily enzyme
VDDAAVVRAGLDAGTAMAFGDRDRASGSGERRRGRESGDAAADNENVDEIGSRRSQSFSISKRSGNPLQWTTIDRTLLDWLRGRAPAPIDPTPAPEPPPLAANHLGTGSIIGRDVITSGAVSPAHVGLRIGDNCHIFAGCKLMIDLISASSGITLGRNVAMNFNCYIDGSGGVEIGDHSLLGVNVVILSSSHRFDQPGKLIQHSGKTFQPTRIGADVWIGSNAVIRSGVEIGRGSIVGAGAVVTRSFPEYSIIGGVPARWLRARFPPSQ